MSPPSAPFPHRTEQEEGEEVNKNNATTSSTSYGIRNCDCDSFGGDPMEDSPADDSFYYEFVRWHLPKVELHAHLYGCIPVSLLQEMAHERGVTLHSKYFRVVTDDDATTTNRNRRSNNPDPNATTATSAPLPDMYNLHPRSLPDCFEMFAELSTIVNDLTAVRRITHAALQEFAHHHVAYLELRSTPKRLRYDHQYHQYHQYHHQQQQQQQQQQNVTNDGDNNRSRNDDSTPSSLCTKLEYCQAILQVMHDFQEQEQRRYDREMADYHIARRRRDDGCSKADDDDNMMMGNTAFKNTSTNKQLLPRLPLVCRFLVSIDRSQSLAEAEENVNLAIALARRQYPTSWSRLVVGLDLGGNPTRQDFETFRPCLQKARDHGLKVTLHCGEIPCNASKHPKAYREARDMLDFGPDRLGHAVLLPPDLLNRLEQLQIPVETCPTSNVMTLELHHYQEQQQEQQNGDSNENNQHGDLVHGLRQHPSLRHWLRVGSKQEINGKSSSNNIPVYPLTIGTDDPGVFDTTATQELWLLATAFRLDRQQLSRIIAESVRFAFCDVDTQHQVQKHIRERVRAILSG